MRYLHRTIITGLSLLSSSFAYAVDFYADLLYWRPSESIDWALTNSNISPSVALDQKISYKTIRFDFAPGFRLGSGIHKPDWNIDLLYTRFNSDTDASTSGNVISTFMPSKFNTKFYQSAHVNFVIDFNIFDLDISRQIQIDNVFDFNPFAGLRGGWINQQINTQYQYPIDVPPASFNPNNVIEKVSNNFSGIGPSIGLGNQWHFYQKSNVICSILGNITASYLWGRWSINDTLYEDNNNAIGGLAVGKRDLGSFSLQALLGVNIKYARYSLNIGYEVSDWFNQYQVFDNGSGTHTNDLVLQGFTMALKYYS